MPLSIWYVLGPTRNLTVENQYPLSILKLSTFKSIIVFMLFPRRMTRRVWAYRISHASWEVHVVVQKLSRFKLLPATLVSTAFPQVRVTRRACPLSIIVLLQFVCAFFCSHIFFFFCFFN